MSKILLLLTQTPWRDFRPYDIQAPALLEAGHEVIYASGAPEAQVERDFTWLLLGVKERRLARKTGGLNLYNKIVKLNPDVVQLCSLEQLPLGLMLKKWSQCKVVYDCREDMASALYERRKKFPLWVRKMIFKGVRAIESAAGRSFDGVITADPGVYGLYEEIADDRKLVCYNSALLDQFPLDYQDVALRQYDLVVLGSMGSARSGTQDVIDALDILHKSGMRVSLLLIGRPDNEMVDEISNRINQYGLKDYVHITGLIPHSDVPATLSQAKIGIVPLHDYPKFHKNIACKAFEYMACGMPTIASDLPPQHLFLDNETAMFYPPADIAAMAESIRSLLGDMDELQRLGQQARSKVEEQWNGEIEQNKLRDFYTEILRRPLRSQDK